MPTTFDALLQSKKFKKAKEELISEIEQQASQINSIRTPLKELEEEYKSLIRDFEKLRGRELFFPFVPSGAGNGPLIELADGSVKYDMITGIGVNFFGHGNLKLDGAWSEVWQGNLGPSLDHYRLIKEVLDSVPKTKLKNMWITTCGATANEIALKIIRQKKEPACKIFAFKDCFAGRTTALQEITDNPKYREGQPVYDEVTHLPFYHEGKGSALEQAEKTISLMNEAASNSEKKYAALEFEIIQGEGGFHFAPREFMVPVIQAAKKLGCAIWVDEIQTFGRTGELFAFQKIGIDEYVDVVTVAKLLQVGGVLYSEEYNPKAGLISGTWSSSTAGLRAGLKALDILKKEMIGAQGKVAVLEMLAKTRLAQMKEGSCSRYIKDFSVIGAMVAFTIYDGSLDSVKKFLHKLWSMGVIAFYCGHGPYRARMLVPAAAISEQQYSEVFSLIEKAIIQTAEENKF